MNDFILHLATSALPRQEGILARIQMRYDLDEEQVETVREMTASGWQHAEVAESWFRWERPIESGMPMIEWAYAFRSTKIFYATFVDPKSLHTGERWIEILASMEPWEFVDRLTLLPSKNAVIYIKPDWEEFARWEASQDARP